MRFPEFAGKSVAVTGAGSNIGREMALGFAAEGANVAICDIDKTRAEQTLDVIAAEGGRHVACEVDVSKSESMESAVRMIVGKYGRIDVLINNAGVTQPGQDKLCDVSEETFDRVIAINLKGVWLAMKYVIPTMLERGGGAIVNISSMRGLTGGVGRSVYAASKHGILGLTRSGALEYGQAGVRINAVCPGLMEEAMINPSSDAVQARAATTSALNPATGRAGRAVEVVATAMFLCSEGASNIHGVALPVDGGYMAG